MPGPKTVDPNLVTADTAISRPGEDAAVVTDVAPGAVLKKGAAPPSPSDGAPGEELVTVRITKAGHGEVHNGEGGLYDWNDVVALPRSVAMSLEKRHYGEMQD